MLNPSRQPLGPEDVKAGTPPACLTFFMPGRSNRWLGIEWLTVLSVSDIQTASGRRE